ncbi:MAG: hypothetical protein RQ714_07945 [Nitrosomonas sp.]|nr:hypothetical protein [Nitrosomonas sp.]
MDAKDGKTGKAPLWQFIRAGDYALPTTVVSRATFKKWTAFKQIFRHSDANGAPPFKTEEELKTLPEARLAYVVPPIDWNAVTDALDLALADWLQESSPKSPVKFVIGQPHAGHGELLDHWANRHDACRVEAPSLKQILDHDEHWLETWPEKGQRWVLPHLEHCYLRHTNGLGLVRRFMEMAVDGRLGFGLIGCDSWARAYLQRVCLSSYWDAWTLQSFDGKRLARLFTCDENAQRQQPLRFINMPLYYFQFDLSVR